MEFRSQQFVNAIRSMVLCGSQYALSYRFAGIHILAMCYCAKKEATHHRAEQKEFLHIQFILKITNQSRYFRNYKPIPPRRSIAAGAGT
jgi:hypothetical protein